MNEILNRLTDRFIDDFTTAKKVFKLDGYYAATSYAAALIGSEVSIDVDKLREARALLGKYGKGFVNVKGTLAKEVAAAAVAESKDPDYAAQKINELYTALRKICSGSDFFGVPATIIYKSVHNTEYNDTIEKVDSIYKGLRQKHPFITSYEDIVGCTLMALSGKSVEEVIKDSEDCFDILKEKYIVNNNAQTVSCVLSIAGGTAEEKCAKTETVEKRLKKGGITFTDRALGCFATIAMAVREEDLDGFIADVHKVSDVLKSVRGLGNFGVGKQFRNLIASAIVTVAYSEEHKNDLKVAAADSIVSIMFAQHLMMVVCMAYAASTAASSIHFSTSSNN